MHEEIETAVELYEQLKDHAAIGIANVKYIDQPRLEQRKLDYLSVEIEKMEIHPSPVLEGMENVLVVNDQFVLCAPYLVFPDADSDTIIVVAYDVSDIVNKPKYKFSLN